MNMYIPAPSDQTMARLRANLAARAAGEGLLDVAYAAVDSPLGPLIVSATPRGVVRIAFDDERLDDVLGELSARVSPRILAAPAKLEAARRELDEYFAGRRRTFDLALDWSLSRGFRREVLAATARIPYAGTSTYGQIAAAAGSPRAFRAAGTALATNPIPVIVPCHRVLPASGTVGQYRGGTSRKELLLELESGAGVPDAVR
jgi:methylated-DNA-[protein]-cysteine S-methyltransferase